MIALASAPFFMFPAIAAFVNRKKSAALILGFNGALTAWIFYGYYAMGAESFVPGPGPFMGVICFLVLLGFALRKDPPSDAELDEEVVLVPYDPDWPRAFESERQRISTILAIAPDAIEHIGSTAVPQLTGKPVVDMMLGVSSLPRPDYVSRLGILGYANLGEAGVPGRIYLRLRGDDKGNFNLHIVERAGAHWTNNLALRDLLRRDSAARESYAAGKLAALASAGNRLLAYSAAKQPLIEELVAQAKNNLILR